MDREELNNEQVNDSVEETQINSNVTNEYSESEKVIYSPIVENKEAFIPPAAEPNPEIPPVYTAKQQKTTPALKNKNIFAIISMVLGIASFVFSCCCFLSLPCGIAAIVFGVLGLKSEKRAMAIAGIVIGALSIVISLVVTISIIVSLILENGTIYYPSYSSHYLW